MKSFKKVFFPGLELAAKQFIPFDVVGFKRDPEYFGVNLLLIKFPGETELGLCIYNNSNGEFIEEPGKVSDYGYTIEEVYEKHSFKTL